MRLQLQQLHGLASGKIEPVTLLNGSVSWAPFDQGWKVSLYGRYLTNKKLFSKIGKWVLI